ncbi:MAG: alpha/beta hydrolase [Actinobacteria bacterium]|nr:alpha/beta hydrolase [Actinomycetota bacterium]
MSRWRWMMRIGAVAAAAVLVTVFVQPVRVRLVAAVTVAEALDVPVARPFAVSVERRPAVVGGVLGDLYDPGTSAPGVVLVPGATPAGADDARVVRLARALARSDRTVFVPVLALYRQELRPDDVDRIVLAAAALSGDDRGPVSLVGISFGGSLCLLAAADARLDGRLAQVATFGAYFDLIGVVQAATTGVSLVGGDRIAWDADPRAQDIVRDRLIQLLPRGQQRPARRALAGDVNPDHLLPSALAVYRVMTNEDPARTWPLAAELPATIRHRIAEVSPSSVAERLDVSIVALHAPDDPVVPFGELLRLGAAVPRAELITVDSFDHVDIDLASPGGWFAAVDDLWSAWRFATAILNSQEGWWP